MNNTKPLLSMFLLAISTTVLHIRCTVAADLNHLVTGLPGQPAVAFKQYAGQVVVDYTLQKALFYWFFEADNPRSTSLPLLLWLTGGPGCSSLFGALAELGPFHVKDDGEGLTLNLNSWTKDANIIFLESPVGVGFSYINSSSAISKNLNDETMAQDALIFLKYWFEKISEFRRNDFYVAGDSYAGHYVPILVRQILESNQVAQPYQINLKGFTIGNPWTDLYLDNLGLLDFLLSHIIIPNETYEAILKDCDFHKYDFFDNNLEGPCNTSVQQALLDFDGLQIYSIYTPNCPNSNSSSTIDRAQKKKRKHLPSGSRDLCLDSRTLYLNRLDVQEALHVTTPTNWLECSDFVFYNYNMTDYHASMLPIYQQLLLKEDLRIWISSGDVSLSVPTMGTINWIKVLNLTVKTPWYPWKYKTQIGGWTQQYKGLTFATIRGAGHMIPMYKPAESRFVFKHFLAGELLPKFVS